MTVNKYLPFAFIYFFINTLGLPLGLTYTAILSPFFYWWVITKRKQEIILPFLGILLLFVIIHIVNGADMISYLISFLNLLTVYIFCQAVYTFFKICEEPEKIYWKLFVVNFILCLIAIPVYFTPYNKILWIQQYLTEGVDNFMRMKLFTYEASYYASLFTPLFFFFFLQIIFKHNKRSIWLILPMLFFALSSFVLDGCYQCCDDRSCHLLPVFI
jgi:hypothetical protein